MSYMSKMLFAATPLVLLPIYALAESFSATTFMQSGSAAAEGDVFISAAVEAGVAVSAIMAVLYFNKYHLQIRRKSASQVAKITCVNRTVPTDHSKKLGSKPDNSAPRAQTQPMAVVETAEQIQKLRMSALLYELAKKGDSLKAGKTLQAFEETFGPAALSDYVCMITSCAKSADAEGACKWLQSMQSHGVMPNIVCFNAVINACAKQGCIQQALSVAESMKSYGVELDTISYNTLIDAWAREGDAAKAQLWMKRMLVNDVKASVVSFGSVMRACAQCGLHQELLFWLEQADKLGIELNMICFSAIINALVKRNDLQGASQWLQRMLDRGVTCSSRCSTNLLNAFLATGDLEQASSVVDKLRAAKAEIDDAVFSSMVSASLRAHRTESAKAWADAAASSGHKLGRAAEAALVAAGLEVPICITQSIEQLSPDEDSALGASRQSMRRACLGKRFTGTVKDFVTGKFGYIECDETFAIFKRDVFLSCDANLDQLGRGQRVTFTLQIDRQRGLPRAADLKVFTCLP